MAKTDKYVVVEKAVGTKVSVFADGLPRTVLLHKSTPQSILKKLYELGINLIEHGSNNEG